MEPPPDYIHFPHAGESMKPIPVWIVKGGYQTKVSIEVSHTYEEAQIRRGMGNIYYDQLKPYSPALWEACQKFIEWRKAQNEAILKAYHNLPHQMNLL